MKRSSSQPSATLLLGAFAFVLVLIAILLQRMMSGASDVDLGAFDFEDVTGVAGMSDVTRTWGSAWTDADHDGFPDAFLGRHWRPPRFLYSVGEGLYREPERALAGIGFDRHSCVWGEANGDGAPDVYCVRGADKGDGTGANQLFIQTAPREFTDRSRGSGTSNPRGRGRTVNWLDFDDDGDLDLFVGNQYRRGHPNLMLRNDGGTFTRVDAGISDELETSSSSWSDWDADGDPDVLVLQHNGPAVAYENTGGEFRRVELAGTEGSGWLSGAWGDFDADGRPDLHLMSVGQARLLHNTPQGFEEVHREEVTFGRMSTWLDVDNDADLDLFLVQGAFGRNPSEDATNEPDLMLVNTGGEFARAEDASWRGRETGNGESVAAVDHDRDGGVDLFVMNGAFQWTGPNLFLRNRSERQSWIGIDLRGKNENPMGIGARVAVTVDDRTLHHQMTDGVNAHSQNETGYLHVGVGDASVARVEVVWSDDRRDCRTTPVDRVVTVRHGSSPCTSSDSAGGTETP